MLGMRINEAKSMFFDRRAVKGMMDKISRRALSRIGSYVRTVMRNRLKKRGSNYWDSSQPGEPPKRHSGHLHDWTFFAYDNVAQNVVIGPADLRDRRGDNVPEILDRGGYTTITAGRNRGQKKYVAPRPFAGPSLDDAEPKFADFWQDAYAGKTYTR